MERNRFRWLLVKRALFKKRSKSLLIVLAVAVAASVAAALLNLELDLRQRMNRELRDYGPNVVIVPSGTSGTVLDESILPALRKGVEEKRILSYTPELFIPAQANGRQTLLVGADLDALRKLFPGWDWIRGSGDVFVGARLARKLNAKPGDKVDLKLGEQAHRVIVAGTVEGGEAEDDQVFADLLQVQNWSGKSGQFQVVAVSALGDLPDVRAWFERYAAAHPGVSFEIVRKIAAAEAQILDKISRLMSLILVIIFVTLFFCINTTVSAILLARQPEIALMRVLGARRPQIRMGLILELLTLATLGGFLGYAIGMVMAQVLGKILFQTFVIPRFSVFVVTLFSALAMMVTSSFLPIRRAINRPAALVLKEA